jgi:hypothetical protein
VSFLLVHLVLAAINLFDDVHLPFGDVDSVYRFWMDYAAQHGVLVGIDTSWVYPVGALLPMGLAYVFGSGPYPVVWLVIVTLLDAVALAVVARKSRTAAWWWVAFLAALGPIAVGRIDSITVPLAIIGLLWLSSRPALAGALLGLGAWIKVWPAALVVAALLAVRGRARVLLGAAVLSAVLLTTALLLGSGANVFGFIFEQGDRGLQLEAPVSGWWLWGAVLGIGDSRVYFARSILTYQVLGDGSSLVAGLMTPVLVLVVAAILLLAIRALRRDASPETLLAPLALALVVAMIAINKVGSPQFYGWLAAPLVLALVIRSAAVVRYSIPVLGIALLTQVVYPWTYSYLVAADPLAAALLTARNLALVVVLILLVQQLWSIGSRAGENGAERRDPTVAQLEEV